MLRQLLKGVLVALLVVLAAGGVLYAAGLRVVFDGGGGAQLRFLASSDEHAEAVLRHREAQRAAATATPTPAAAAPAPAAVASASPATDKPGASSSPIPGAGPADPTPASPAGSTYWTGFRGPRRDGAYDQQPILTSWPEAGPRQLWKQPIGLGHGSFAIARGRAFTIEQRGPQEVVAAYDVATGRELWTNGWTATFRESMGGDGPRSTPAWADGRVFALGGTGELRALDDVTGRVVWRTDILKDTGARNLQWGMAGSPLVEDGVVIVQPGGSGGQSVVAYATGTGKRVWSALDDQQSYSSPMVVELNGVRQLLIFSAERVAGMTLDSRQVLWDHPWRTNYDVNASQPLVFAENRVFLSTGYGQGAVMLEVTRAEPKWSVREVWRNIRMKNQFTSSLFHDGYLYGLDESILACLDANTGDVKWKGGRYGYGQVVLASGHLIVLTEGGELALVRATPESHQELRRVAAIEGKTWNHPALSDGYLLIRNGDEMAGYDLKR